MALVFFWSPATRRCAVPCWLLLLGFLSGLAGSLAGPIFVALVALMAVGFVTEVLARRREQQHEGECTDAHAAGDTQRWREGRRYRAGGRGESGMRSG